MDFLTTSFYVYDGLISFHDLKTATDVIQGTIKVCEECRFDSS